MHFRRHEGMTRKEPPEELMPGWQHWQVDFPVPVGKNMSHQSETDHPEPEKIPPDMSHQKFSDH